MLPCFVLVALAGCSNAALDEALSQRDRALETLEQTTRMVQASKDKADGDAKEALAAKAESERATRIAKIARKKALDQLRKVQSELGEAKKKIKTLEKELEKYKRKSKQ